MRALQTIVTCWTLSGAHRVGFAGPVEGIGDYIRRGVILGAGETEVPGRAVADYVPPSVGNTFNSMNNSVCFGATQVLCNTMGSGGTRISSYEHYKGVRSNVISITRGWGSSNS